MALPYSYSSSNPPIIGYKTLYIRPEHQMLRQSNKPFIRSKCGQLSSVHIDEKNAYELHRIYTLNGPVREFDYTPSKPRTLIPHTYGLHYCELPQHVDVFMPPAILKDAGITIIYAKVHILGTIVKSDFLCVTDKIYIEALLSRSQLEAEFTKGPSIYITPSQIQIHYINGKYGRGSPDEHIHESTYAYSDPYTNTTHKPLKIENTAENQLPAIIYPNGRQEWWVDGERHRGDHFPAIIHADGTYEFWNHGERYEDIKCCCFRMIQKRRNNIPNTDNIYT